MFCAGLFVFDPFSVAMEFLGLVLHDRGRRSTGDSQGEDRSASQFLLADGLVPLQRENEIGAMEAS
jgi:hypothetical protein